VKSPAALPARAGLIPQVFPAINFPSTSVERTRIACIVPPEGNGLVVRGVDAFLPAPIAPSNSDYWVIELGTVNDAGFFKPKAQFARTLGFAKGRNGMDFNPKVRYANGETLAVRMLPKGAPAALTTLDVVLRLQES
jgi:hypothetical protein